MSAPPSGHPVIVCGHQPHSPATENNSKRYSNKANNQDRQLAKLSAQRSYTPYPCLQERPLSAHQNPKQKRNISSSLFWQAYLFWHFHFSSLIVQHWSHRHYMKCGICAKQALKGMKLIHVGYVSPYDLHPIWQGEDVHPWQGSHVRPSTRMQLALHQVKHT